MWYNAKNVSMCCQNPVFLSEIIRSDNYKKYKRKQIKFSHIGGENSQMQLKKTTFWQCSSNVQRRQNIFSPKAIENLVPMFSSLSSHSSQRLTFHSLCTLLSYNPYVSYTWLSQAYFLDVNREKYGFLVHGKSSQKQNRDH